jgi:uncharacterized protein YecE (DUF72 family)
LSAAVHARLCDDIYSRKGLREWVPRLRELDAEAPLTLVYFNNHFRGQAVHGARDLGQLMLGLT